MTKRNLSAAQHAALDHDGDGKAGGSKPRADSGVADMQPATPADETLSEYPDSNEPAPEAEQETPPNDDDGTRPEVSPDASAPVEEPAAGAEEGGDQTQAPVGEQPVGAGDGPGLDAGGAADGVADDPAAGRLGDAEPVDAPAPAVEDEDQAALAPAVENENQAPTAVNLEKAIPALRDMASNRYGLYHFPAHRYYSSEPGGGGAHHASHDINALIEAGLASRDDSGGAHGSVKITPAGRDQLQLASVA